VTILRFSNVYGPRQRLAGDHQGFLPVFVRRVIEGEPITLFGDGSHERECLYVDDAVAALLTATTSDAAVGEVFNISHPQAHSLCEIAETLVEIAGEGEIQSRPWPEERERIAIGSTRVDSAKAQMTLGWRSQVDLSEGFARTLAFYRTEVET
jgi:UDP-glucose 4-epimerase